MSMNANPGHGYFIPVEDFRKFLTPTEGKQLDAALEESDQDAIGKALFAAFKREGFPTGDIMIPSEEDYSEGELEDGTAYVQFSTGDLFTLKPKVGLKNLEAAGFDPEETLFTVWG
jgi:hypothetical protein